MTVMRFIHIVSAFVFLSSGILRTYWLFAGNRFARWTAFVPVTAGQRREARRQTAWYLFLSPHDPPVSSATTPWPPGTYLVVFFLFLLQTVTGFALVGAHGTEPWADLVRLGAECPLRAPGRSAHPSPDHVGDAGLHGPPRLQRAPGRPLRAQRAPGSIFSGFKFVTRREIDEARDGGMEIQEEAE